MKKHTIKLFLSGLAIIAMAACGDDPNDPGTEYAPDMYVSKGYEPYSQLQDQVRAVKDENGKEWLINKDGKNMRLPVKGTIARGQMDYYFPYDNTNDGYEKAGVELKNPLAASEENLAEGKRVYEINCTPCHGKDGKADGTIVNDNKYPPPPSYDSDRIKGTSDGKMYYSITMGKNLMGSYASALTPTERWQVIHYIRKLSGGAAPAPVAATDSTATVK